MPPTGNPGMPPTPPPSTIVAEPRPARGAPYVWQRVDSRMPPQGETRGGASLPGTAWGSGDSSLGLPRAATSTPGHWSTTPGNTSEPQTSRRAVQGTDPRLSRGSRASSGPWFARTIHANSSLSVYSTLHERPPPRTPCATIHPTRTPNLHDWPETAAGLRGERWATYRGRPQPWTECRQGAHRNKEVSAQSARSSRGRK